MKKENTMKMISAISALALAASTMFAAPAIAQDASGTTATPAPTMVENEPQAPATCSFGNLCGGGSLSINAIGQSGSAGHFEAYFGGGANVTGEAGATERGGSYSDIAINFSTCDDADCADNGITAKVGAFKYGETSAWAYSATPGESAMAGNVTQSLAIAQFAASVCSDACAPE